MIEDDESYEGWTNWHTWHVKLLMDNIYEYYITYYNHMQKFGAFKSVAELRGFVSGLFEMKTKEPERYDDETDFDKVNWLELLESINSAYYEDLEYRKWHGCSTMATNQDITTPYGLEAIELSLDDLTTNDSQISI